MFQLNVTTHNMKLRKQEKFKVKSAKTVRMQRSAIPQMTKHLNNKYVEKITIISKLTKANN